MRTWSGRRAPTPAEAKAPHPKGRSVKKISTFARAVIALTVLTVLAYEPGAFAATGTLPSAHLSASATFSTASAPCTKATADALLDQYRLNAFLLAQPAVQVLCGPFAGPASKAMVVAIGAGTCWGAQGWALFSSSAGDWKLAFHDYDWIILPLVPVGSAIKETGPVFRPTDPRCVPTGGTRARTWEWDGHTLVAGPWHQVSKGPPPPTTVASTKPLAPCTAKVITAIAKSGVQNFYNVDGFGCSGEFAYAFVTVATPQHRPIAEITVLFMASKGTWHLASRAIYCENRSVPPAIYQDACETN